MLWSTSSTAGTRYTGATMISTQSRLGMIEFNPQAYKELGTTVSNSTSNPILFHGYLATTTSGVSAIINLSDVIGTTGRMLWNYQAVSD